MSDNDDLMDDLFGEGGASGENVDNHGNSGVLNQFNGFNDDNDDKDDKNDDKNNDTDEAHTQPTNNPLEYNEEDMPNDGVILEQVRTATMDINNLPPIRTSTYNSLARIPNFLNIQSAGFDRQTFEDDDKNLPSNANTSNTIRWRWNQDEDGHTVAQSNSRFIRWSDGSLSLQVGKEMYDINLNHDADTDTRTNPRQFAFLHHEKNQVVMGDSVIDTQLNFVPPSLASNVHKKYASTVNDKHFKAAKMKMVDKETESKDPHKELLKKMEDDKKSARNKAKMERAAAKKEAIASGHNLDWSSDDDDLSRAAASRRIGARGTYEKDQDDGFVVEDEEDGAMEEGIDDEEDDDGQHSLDSLEDAENRIEQEKKVYKKRVESDEED
ncbi:hypothetical protein E3P81_00999 [Wallemia ichthyophaga]|nr:hypothetical protein E3P97_01000 [Wallemia ichthyophaga]TIB29585.1 hypothetical protein E3P85_03113 [Wallemia ichthyophaga]TIB49089.1 hypothetical protein E3P82_00998 [Wallemia ichthyophaga]TIB53042.1 hypothetical protein E3P81_00999 [Wallemia ichthyophaga]TIB55671.1 hypothetical protein E3P80_00999 [Wallemia ichthyophaga]